MKKLFCTLSLLLLLQPAFAQQKRWKVVIVAATEEPNISEAGQKFVARATEHFSELSQALGLTLDISILQGRELSPAGMRELREQLLSPTLPSCKLLTWVSFTHGFNTENSGSEFPFLIAHPTKTVLAPSEMRYAFGLQGFYEELLKSGNFGHVHVWAELCNQICRGCDSEPASGLASLSGMGGKQALEDVLYGEKGTLMVSSSYGQESCASIAGGPFNRAIFEGLQMIKRGEWKPEKQPTRDFAGLVRQLTATFLSELPEEACRQQRPLIRIGG